MSQPNNRYRYEISSRLGTLQVAPLGEADFTIEWTRQDDARLEYQKALPSKVTIKDEPTNPNNGYRHLLKLEQSKYRCEYVSITVQQKCTASGSVVWLPFFSGRLSLNDGDWDITSCSVVLKVTDIKVEQCYEDGKDTEVNLLGSITNKYSVSLTTAGVVLEKRSYFLDIMIGSGDCFQEYWGETGTSPDDGGWIYFYSRHYQTLDDNLCHTETQWAREVLMIPCGDPSPGSEWILDEDTCPSGQQKYVRPARTYQCTYNPPDPSDSTQEQSYRCYLLGDVDDTTTVIDNGMLLSDVINIFVSNLCPGLQFVSNFFQINPDVITNINYVTTQQSKTAHIVVFQKSDVKRPNDSNNATQAVWTIDKCFKALTTAYNLKWTIDGSIIRMEHVSYFSKNQGIDLTNPRYAVNIKGKYQYSYDTANIPTQENFKWMEAKPGDFQGFPIIYSGACVGVDSQAKTYTIDDVTTDVELIKNNPDSDSQVVSDQGFVLMACDIVGGDYHLITESPIFGGSTLNNTLSWAHLHRDYYRYDRPLRRGNLNQVDTLFFTIRPTKKGTAISIPYCCDDTFDPNDQITGLFGPAEVSKATYSFLTQMLTLELLYDPEYNIFNNQSPVAVNDTAFTYQDTLVAIDVLANDSDPDGTISSVVIVSQPIHGTATVNSLNQIEYTTATGYVGSDNIVYNILDDYNQPSNNALVAIDVLEANTAPVAVDDSYYTPMNTTLNIAPPGVFSNDTDDTGYTLAGYDATSSHGGTVTMNPDGSFTYVPPTGFVGTDTFLYTIQDAQSLTDSATVSIDVRDPSNPVAQNDIYNTKVNTNLMIAAPGVLTNDSTMIGSLSAVAATGTTTNGGAYTLNTDGSFSYNPATGYIGTDSFGYTATNGTGTDTASVIINVLPNVYIRLQKMNDMTTFLYQDCNNDGSQEEAGQTQSAIFRAFFYSNSAGTVAYDVTGLGLTINYQIQSQQSDGTPNAPSNITTGVVSGTSYDIFNGTYYRNQFDCSNNIVSYLNENYSLQSGNYTIL